MDTQEEVPAAATVVEPVVEEKMSDVEEEKISISAAAAAAAAAPVEEEGGDSLPKVTEKEEEESKESEQSSSEQIDFKIVYNKKKYDITFGLDDTVGQLKSHLQDVIGVPSAMQKILIKGLAKDEMSLRKLGVTRGAKVMVVGSTLSDVLEVAKKPTPQQLKEVEEKEVKKESWSQQKQHKKVLEKGVPEDVMPGLKVENKINYMISCLVPTIF